MDTSAIHERKLSICCSTDACGGRVIVERKGGCVRETLAVRADAVLRAGGLERAMVQNSQRREGERESACMRETEGERV